MGCWRCAWSRHTRLFADRCVFRSGHGWDGLWRLMVQRMLHGVGGCPWRVLFSLSFPRLAAPPRKRRLLVVRWLGVYLHDLSAPRGAEADALAGMA